MSRVAVIIDDLFEDSEYSEPAKAFKEAGHTLTHLGLEAAKTVNGKKAVRLIIELRKWLALRQQAPPALMSGPKFARQPIISC